MFRLQKRSYSSALWGSNIVGSIRRASRRTMTAMRVASNPMKGIPVNLDPARIMAALIGLTLLTLGCSQSSTVSTPPPEPHSHRPASLADGVATLHGLRDSVKAAFDAGKPNECDGALHEAAEILSVLPEVAKDEGKLAEDGLETVKTASKDLFDQFMKIHEGFHGHEEQPKSGEGEPNAYDAVADNINAALDQLSSLNAP